MFLTASNLVHYLVARGTLPAAAVVDGDFMVTEAGRRNRNFKVLRRRGPGLFIKQVKGLDPMAISTLQREAACYRLVQQPGAYAGLARMMPRFVDHDPGRHSLTLELLEGGESLTEFHQRRRDFPAEIGTLLGRQLGQCHQTLAGAAQRPEDLAHLPRQAPWILSFHQTHNFLPGALSGGTQQLADIIRGSGDLPFLLERLRQQWRYDSLIHGDMKWDNCQIVPDRTGELQLKLIDWELVDYGDAAWDVGSVFQAYLSWLVFAMPLTTESDPRRRLALAPFPLEAMFPALQAFWTSYADTRGLPPQHRGEALLRAVEYGGARLVQTAFECLHAAPAMTPIGATLLQLAHNILRDPRQAAGALLGLTESSLQ